MKYGKYLNIAKVITRYSLSTKIKIKNIIKNIIKKIRNIIISLHVISNKMKIKYN